MLGVERAVVLRVSWGTYRCSSASRKWPRSSDSFLTFLVNLLPREFVSSRGVLMTPELLETSPSWYRTLTRPPWRSSSFVAVVIFHLLLIAAAIDVQREFWQNLAVRHYVAPFLILVLFFVTLADTFMIRVYRITKAVFKDDDSPSSLAILSASYKAFQLYTLVIAVLWTFMVAVVQLGKSL